jgi:hypothetical protein
MKKNFVLPIILSAIALAGCQQRMFGVDETTWSTLSEQEREIVIEGYNRRREIELANGLKTKEKELENERHRQEVEAQTAPFYAAADAISSMCGKEEKTQSSNRIQALSHRGGQSLTIRDTEFKVSYLTKMSDAWLKGQRVQISKNDDDMFYSVKIKNLENGEVVLARKK